jgi:putative flippase GtrA
MYGLARNVWRIIEKLVRGFFRVLHIRLSEKQMEGFLQFVKFGIIGLSNTAVSYVLYLATLFFLQSRGWLPKADYLVGNVVGFVLSVLWSFYWNRKFVFRAEEGRQIPWLQALIKTYISYAFTGLFLNSLLSVLWVEVFGMSKVYAPILNLVISVPLNFVLNKFWAFRSR